MRHSTCGKRRKIWYLILSSGGERVPIELDINFLYEYLFFGHPVGQGQPTRTFLEIRDHYNVLNYEFIH